MALHLGHDIILGTIGRLQGARKIVLLLELQGLAWAKLGRYGRPLGRPRISTERAAVHRLTKAAKLTPHEQSVAQMLTKLRNVEDHLTGLFNIVGDSAPFH